jgi:LysR family glycine cleavage system transcriptional activator
MAWFLPSLSALRTFEAAARHLSFTRAAAELNITQSAVSRQIRGLEDYLRLKLFERTPQQLILTPVGRAYLEEIRAALDRIQAATLTMLSDQGRGGMLVVATLPAFAMKWLIPRLNLFYTERPDIGINLVTRNAPFDFDNEGIDAAIHYGNKDWTGVAAQRLIGDEMVAVCSPGYLATHPPLNALADLENHVLLQNGRRPRTWQAWLEAVGAPAINHWAGPRFEHFYMMLQAALAGLGIALMPKVLVADDLASERLVLAFDLPYRTEEAYYVVHSEGKGDDPRVKSFREWLLRTAQA